MMTWTCLRSECTTGAILSVFSLSYSWPCPTGTPGILRTWPPWRSACTQLLIQLLSGQRIGEARTPSSPHCGFPGPLRGGRHGQHAAHPRYPGPHPALFHVLLVGSPISPRTYVRACSPCPTVAGGWGLSVRRIPWLKPASLPSSKYDSKASTGDQLGLRVREGASALVQGGVRHLSCGYLVR